jgi:hypothetical protein
LIRQQIPECECLFSDEPPIEHIPSVSMPVKAWAHIDR